MTITARNIGPFTFLINDETSIANPFFLLSLIDPCGLNTKFLVIQPQGCQNSWELTITGVAHPYEDFLSGDIFWNIPGTWRGTVYYQDSDTNLDPSNATMVRQVLFQIVE
ncbi:hypothetical protein [Moorena sp. SIO3H5]|uniref:hypothetical protein n=1 Tax=Moorena sp. SIO3H5 TaxID=2607834 RepID=UPI0013BC95F9|nr:hypothetical protein [Moorena sp. SIO3H5]NEO72147.1 hypothetical protein [Moorena sp. SIO3H5]